MRVGIPIRRGIRLGGSGFVLVQIFVEIYAQIKRRIYRITNLFMFVSCLDFNHQNLDDVITNQSKD